MGSTRAVALPHGLHVVVRRYLQGRASVGHFDARAGWIKSSQSNVNGGYERAGDERYILHTAACRIEESIHPYARVGTMLNREHRSLNVLTWLRVQKLWIPVRASPTPFPFRAKERRRPAQRRPDDKFEAIADVCRKCRSLQCWSVGHGDDQRQKKRSCPFICDPSVDDCPMHGA
jgi:hypothetical protein